MMQTLTEKIFSRNLGRPVKAGEMVVVKPDVAMGHDSLSPGIIKIMREQLGIESVADPSQIVLVMDHVAPASTVGNANACLLYTSPSPRDATLSRMPSSA